MWSQGEARIKKMQSDKNLTDPAKGTLHTYYINTTAVKGVAITIGKRVD